MDTERPGDFRIGRWTVRSRLLCLEGAEGPVRLQPRVMGVLGALASAAGEVVTRDELIRSVWGGRVVSDDAVNRCIVELRRALGDGGQGPVIETIPKVGYRLTLPVTAVGPEAVLAQAVAAAAPAATTDQWPGRRPRAVIGISALVAIVVVIVLAIWAQSDEAAEASSTRISRLAVLPLENLGGDPAFAGGVYDTLITQLGKVPGLTVISRGSVKQYEGNVSSTKQIARDLDVDGILSGSVQRIGDQVRIHVHLVDAGHDRNLWAETYDRPATDVFAVQSDIARTVAEQLKIRLAGADAARLLVRPTTNAAAYEHFMLGREHISALRFEDAIRELTLAVNLDPEFVAAHALLGLAHTWSSRSGSDEQRRAGQLALAKSAVDRALSIDAAAPEAQLALAVYLYSGMYDIRAAEPAFERAVAALPNDALAHTSFAYLRRRQGRLDEAMRLFERALQIDPRGPAAYSVPLTLMEVGRGEEAKRYARRGLEANPDDEALQTFPALAAQRADCDFDAARSLLAELPAETVSRPRATYQAWNLAMTTGNHAHAIELARRLAIANGNPDGGADLELALAQVGHGQLAASRAVLVRAREKFERQITEPSRPVQLVADSLSNLALVNVLLGDRRLALDQMHRALELIGRDDADALAAMDVQLAALSVFARAGQLSLAVAAAERLLGGKYAPSAMHVWCSYEVAPLRSDPEFRALMRAHGTDVEIDPLRPVTWKAAHLPR